MFLGRDGVDGKGFGELTGAGGHNRGRRLKAVMSSFIDVDFIGRARRDLAGVCLANQGVIAH